jgi:regulation of enolase protein 1 (concanavalin A-like superfamily)
MHRSARLSVPFVFCILASVVVAQEKGGPSPLGWGTVVDPDGDCKIGRNGEIVTIDVPGKIHDLSPEQRKVNAPRILGDVKGDFIAEVEAVGAVQPGGQGTRQGGFPYNGVGLLLWQDEGTMVRLERAAILRNGSLFSYVNLEYRKEGRPVAAKPLQIEDRPLHLRLERRKGTVIGSVSFDGVRWTALEPVPVELAESVKVGIAAVNSATQPFKAEVKGFELFSSAKDH